MRIFDCFPFFNELDLLELRLRELGDTVDRFVLVEANETQTGLPKPFVFEQNKARFARWADKIIHVKVTFPADLPRAEGKYARMGGWEREHYQRNQIARGLETAAPDDLVIVSDLDEIVRAQALRRCVETGVARRRLLVFAQSHHRFRLDLIAPGGPWLLGSRAVLRRHLRTPQSLRRARVRRRRRRFVPDAVDARLLQLRNLMSSGIGLPVEIVEDGGWHFTSIGSFEDFARKMRAVVEGDIIVGSSVDEAYANARARLRPFPRDALPACVGSGDFDHLLEPAPA